MKSIFFAFLIFLGINPLYAERRVYVDAVADLMHSGHVALFKRARQEGDRLIVGIHSDETVASYKRKPVMTMEERIAVVEACRYVDEVIPNAPLLIDEEYIRSHHIDLVIHGDDISPENCEKWYGIPLQMGILKLVSYTQGISTTDLIRRVLEEHSDER